MFEGPVRNALHRLKYQRDVALGEALARPMIQCLQELGWQIDLVTATPMGVVRLAERGYNQADLLARPVALGLGLPYKPKAAAKTKETRSQVGLNLAQRRENVAGAFRARPAEVEGQRILLVDDVSTSGATLDACARALLDGGAAQVWCFTLARAWQQDIKAVQFSQ
ncbi:MAG: ComF family protein [Chloroflexi bacterium]|nr:ComF family protein [Chloroflexota bacterium]